LIQELTSEIPCPALAQDLWRDDCNSVSFLCLRNRWKDSQALFSVSVFIM